MEIIQKQEQEKQIKIYADGGYCNRHKIGGWAAILKTKQGEKEISGLKKQTTNNQMELLGIIEALKKLKWPCNCKIYSDSTYVVNAFKEGYIYNWEKNNWRKSDNKQIKNKSLWQKLYQLTKKQINVEYIKVKGHSDNEYNNRCDSLATKQIQYAKFLKHIVRKKVKEAKKE